MTLEFTGFRPAAFRFLRDLGRNNNREWFEQHRDVYESELKGPLAALVEDVDVRLAGMAPEIIGHPKRSLFRIHRDVRFSADKSPYKTNVACWFHHIDGGNGVGVAAPHGGAGYYYHMEAGRISIGGGIWMPPRATLGRIREAIAEDHRPLTKILGSADVRRRFGGLAEENMLTRMPRGYAPDHPAAGLLRHQSFTLGRELPLASASSVKLVGVLAADYARMLPLVRWINTTLGLKTLARR